MTVLGGKLEKRKSKWSKTDAVTPLAFYFFHLINTAIFGR